MADGPLCRKCGAELNGPVGPDDVTACPRCGKRWQLNPARTAIATATLQVQGGQHGMRSDVQGVKPNG